VVPDCPSAGTTPEGWLVSLESLFSGAVNESPDAIDIAAVDRDRLAFLTESFFCFVAVQPFGHDYELSMEKPFVEGYDFRVFVGHVRPSSVGREGALHRMH
jgi:hypothetical protein